MIAGFDEQAVRDQADQDGVTHFATGVAVFRDDRLLVVRRAAHDSLGGVYELPGGGVDAGETIAEGAIREAFEETGLRVHQVVDVFDGFDYQTRTKPHVRQCNFIVSVEPGEVVLEPNEHDAYRWITEGEVAELETTKEMKQCLWAAFKKAPKNS